MTFILCLILCAAVFSYLHYESAWRNWQAGYTAAHIDGIQLARKLRRQARQAEQRANRPDVSGKTTNV